MDLFKKTIWIRFQIILHFTLQSWTYGLGWCQIVYGKSVVKIKNAGSVFGLKAPPRQLKSFPVFNYAFLNFWLKTRTLKPNMIFCCCSLSTKSDVLCFLRCFLTYHSICISIAFTELMLLNNLAFFFFFFAPFHVKSRNWHKWKSTTIPESNVRFICHSNNVVSWKKNSLSKIGYLYCFKTFILWKVFPKNTVDFSPRSVCKW